MSISRNFLGVALLGACTHQTSAVTPAQEASRAPVSWLCRPGQSPNPCRTANLDATELHQDASRALVPHRAAEQTGVDCFYVYPTVDLDLTPANHQDLRNVKNMLRATEAQAARFGEVCDLWVPLYRQVTLGTYLQPRDVLEDGLRVAFTDVERAFGDYLAHADGSRKIVLLGHSQGGEMVLRLLRRFFDDDEGMRARLLLAFAIGAEIDDGSLKNVRACSHALETKCLVAFRTHAAGEAVEPDRFAPPAGRKTVCVNPASLDLGADPGDRAPLSRTYFTLWPEVRHLLKGVKEVKSPFVLLRSYYSARCMEGPRGYAYLEATSPPATRELESPVDFRDKRLRMGKLGLHLLDLQLPQGDLIDMVARRAPTEKKAQP